MRVCAMAPDPPGKLTVATEAVDETAVLTAYGVLDTTTYLSLRDSIIKAALDEPKAVIIVVSQLFVPAESAWAVFTSARWHVGRWPEVPILLVCAHAFGRASVARNGVARYVPVYSTIGAALDALSPSGPPHYRRRAREELPAKETSVRRSRELVTECLSAWTMTDLIPVTQVVVTALVENVLEHTDSPPAVRLETDGTAVTVAVEDASHVPAGVREQPKVNEAPSGLRIVAALCRMWGNAPTPAGKTVWAVIGPENRL
jgi:hypothetical protein